MSKWLPFVAQYIRVLADALDTTSHASDRRQYEAHLAQSARLVEILTNDGGRDRVDNWIAGEEHAYGWTYLSDSQGEAASGAFAELVETLRRQGYSTGSSESLR